MNAMSLETLEAMSDAEFMAQVESLRAQESGRLRGKAAWRWCRINWPDDPPSSHEEEARKLFRRPELDRLVAEGGISH